MSGLWQSHSQKGKKNGFWKIAMTPVLQYAVKSFRGFPAKMKSARNHQTSGFTLEAACFQEVVILLYNNTHTRTPPPPTHSHCVG